jgi:hypothetical protein
MLGMVVGLKASLVDDDLVVEPAKGDQILRVGGTPLRPRHEVMDLKTVGAGTAVGGAAVPVAVEDGPS